MINKYFLVKMNIPAYLKKFLYRNSESEELPDGYTELEYIENDGNQYLQGSISGLSNNENIKLELYSYKYTADGGFFSLLNSTSNNRSFYTGYGFNNAIYVASYPNRNFFKVSNTAATGEHIIERKSDKSIYIDGTLATEIATSATLVDFSNVNSFYVGKSSTTGAILPARYKRITITGKLDLIPAKRNSDNVLGMYDTVTDTFFTNAGTGTFNAGPVVTKI